MMDYDDRADEEIRYNRSRGIDDNREGDEWNQPRILHPGGYKAGKTFARKMSQPLAQPAQQVGWVQARDAGERDAYELALWHYRFLHYWRESHDRCPCGQPDDGEAALPVSMWLDGDL